MNRDDLRKIRTFPALVKYLREELDWPIDTDDFEDITFEYSAEELGIDKASAAKIQEIKRLRPLAANQPWGIFFVKFEPKRLPVVALRRILSGVIVRKRASANPAERTTWDAEDLLFISNYGEGEGRQVSFAHFSHDEETDLPVLRVLGWDGLDTPLHLDLVADTLKQKLSWPDNEEDLGSWRINWRSAFTLRHRYVITTSKALAVRLAELARATRERTLSAIGIETENGPLRKLMRAFREGLIHDLDETRFADMYAQTIAYGLLSARIANPDSTSAGRLASQMPITSPFLRELMGTFLEVGGRRGRAASVIDFDELGISDVVSMLNAANMDAVVRDFGDRNPLEDPVIHFYELFLKEYDAVQRMQRGVFYTPRPVVARIVREAHQALQRDFGLKGGLADTSTWAEVKERHPDVVIPEDVSRDQPFVRILDPATGTGTFLVEVIAVVHETLLHQWAAEGLSQAQQTKRWNDYVPKHLLPRLFGFELLMAPYAIAHLKIGLKLHETGYKFEAPGRANIYLTNSLEPARPQQVTLAVPALAHEAQAVSALKRANGFTVIVGNPPYSKMSANLTEDAVALVEAFRFVDGERIVEKGALALELNLQDDYIKFWGFSCAESQRSGAGIVAMITNSRYLSAPTLRGVRGHLAAQFSRATFIDLGGQVSERRAIEGDDQNVFDIEQGVTIAVLSKVPGQLPVSAARYLRATGTRDEKYNFLLESSGTEGFATISLEPPLYRFSREVDESEKEFGAWARLDEIMPFNSGSIITSRDNLAIDREAEALMEKIDRFAASPEDDETILEEIGFSVKAKWDVEACKREIRRLRDKRLPLRTILYRPFDRRWIYYLPSLLDTPSRPVCESIFGKQNLVLLTPGVKTANEFNHVLVSREPAEKKSCSHDRATQMFPLFDYRTGKRVSNVRSEFRGAATDEEAFAYMYAVLSSAGYASRYASALRDSYPRVPLPIDKSLFSTLSNLGKQLIANDLLELPHQTGIVVKYHAASKRWKTSSTAPEVSDIGFEGPEWPVVEKPVWEKERVLLSRRSDGPAFLGVSEADWETHIGGYQTLEKWLKDRKRTTLSRDDVEMYCRIISAVRGRRTIRGQIDGAIDAHGGWPGAFIEGSALAKTSQRGNQKGLTDF